MGREIRRVPADWEHPKDERGHFILMYDEEYVTKAREWVVNCIAWEQGTHEDLTSGRTTKEEYPFYWEWSDSPPDDATYRPSFTSEPTHFQIYETVSEGTPVSPVFASRDDLADWLVSQGTSRDAANAFAEGGWAPSMVFSQGRGLAMNYEALTAFRNGAA